ncbi:hypothetical protein DL762_006242 [Monosporascus cannonballus]|uniref:Major facilitator superfamily (MFS) profile domain-containing protein n=1 Tax=Monosporascus cannonballus TaxID=155416 RepID=A0ABY0H3N8_9PEZI|nr:hypothetical protein DL762_006242 [Monosporascus cannonballus]
MSDLTPSSNGEKREPLTGSPDIRPGSCPDMSWMPEEEKAVVKKIDFIVLSMLMAIYFMFQLDRANIGFALTDNFLADVGITQNHILEAGFMPAGLYTLSQWYKNSELSRRFAAFFAGYLLGQAVNGLLAYGILHMRGIEGMWTVLMGVVFGCLFPASLSRPVPFVGLRYFTDREAFILRQRIVQEDSYKRAVSQNIPFKAVFKTLANKKLWLHAMMTLCGAIPSASLAIYGPSIINSFGYEALASNALFSVADWISLCLVLGVGYVARGIITLIGTMTMLAFSALPTMGINVALIAGAQIFRSDDRPLYYRGRTIIVGAISLAVASNCALLVLYALSNRRISKKPEYGDPHDLQEEVAVVEPIVVEPAPRAHKKVYNI